MQVSERVLIFFFWWKCCSYLIIIKFAFQGSKYRAPKELYEQTNQSVEKWTKIVHLAVAKVTVLASVLPKLITSIVAYLVTDLGNEAFVLPIPMWLVDDKRFKLQNF